MRVLMLVATSVATDSRVLRSATALADDGHAVHIIGKSVPSDFVPPAGVTVSSVGTSSVFRAEGAASLSGRRLSRPARAARWLLLPEQRRSAYGRWARGAGAQAREREFDVVHAHDYTALGIGAALARERAVPLVYDSHEMWSEIRRDQRPTPLEHWLEGRRERRWGDQAAAVVTVGDGVADALRRRYGWPHVTVVRNTFPLWAEATPVATPTAFLYAGRLAAQRDLETVAAAASDLPLPTRLMGPADATWLGSFDPGRAEVLPPVPAADASRALRAAGVALVTLTDTSGNQRLALPNKVFQAVSCGVPVVASRLGELGRLVDEYGLGATYEPGNRAGLVAACLSVVDRYDHYSRRVAQAQEHLTWPRDRENLQQLYRSIAHRNGPTDG